jgi:hypothetical protein
MVILDIPTVMSDRNVQLVRATLAYGEIICEDEWVKQEIEDLKSSGGFSGSCPDHELALARLCERWLRARIVERIRYGTAGPIPPNVVC